MVAALNVRAWAGVARTFVALSLPQAEHGHWHESRGLKLPDLEALLGGERVAAFLRRITDRPSRRGLTPTCGLAAGLSLPGCSRRSG